MGGDGTLNEVLNGMADGFGKVRLGPLPLGTGNDFARSIGIPADLEGALEILAEGGPARWMWRSPASAAGARALLPQHVGGWLQRQGQREAGDEAKEGWGPLSYSRSALGALPELHGFQSVITLNGSERLELRPTTWWSRTGVSWRPASRSPPRRSSTTACSMS